MINANSRNDILNARQYVLQARNGLINQLNETPGIHSTGIMFRRGPDGNPTDEICLGVFFDHGMPGEEAASRDFPGDMGIPASVDVEDKAGGSRNVVSVGVQAVYMPSAPQPENVRMRPVPGGLDIGPLVGVGVTGSGSSGTVGGCVWDRTNQKLVFLTNRHVTGTMLNSLYIQPSAAGTGNFSADIIGHLSRYSTSVDAAIIEPTDQSLVATSIHGIGPGVFDIAVNPPDAVERTPEDLEANQYCIGDLVTKSGAGTGLTQGVVFAADVCLAVPGPQPRRIIVQSPADDRFTSSGDSGSLYVWQNPGGTSGGGLNFPKVIGLHYAGDGSLANMHNVYYSHGYDISDVFAALDLDKACTGVIRNIMNGNEAVTRGVVARGVPFQFSHELEAELRKGQKGERWVSAVEHGREAIVLLLLDEGYAANAKAAFDGLFNGGGSVQAVMAASLSESQIAPFLEFVEQTRALSTQLDGFLDLTQSIFAGGGGKSLRELMA